MIFQERKLPSAFEYTVEDLFGEIVLVSVDQLNSLQLDAAAMGIVRAGRATGSIGDTITYRFERASAWIEDDEVIIESLSLWKSLVRRLRRSIASMTSSLFKRN